MEDAKQAVSAVRPAGGFWGRDLPPLALLLALVFALHVWMIANTLLTARDSIGYIRYALEFERFADDAASTGKGVSPWQVWQNVLSKNHQHPGYPLTIWAMSIPVRAALGCTPESMQLSAQLASNLAAVLLVIPMFYLGKAFFDRRVGFWTALLFQLLPVVSHHLADGVSEPLYLLLGSSTLLCAVEGFRRQSQWRFGLAGAFGGMTYLTRPEGVLLLAAAGLVLLAMAVLGAWRSWWRGALACGASMTLAAVAVGSLYFLATGHFTNKPSLGLMIGRQQAQRQPPSAVQSGSDDDSAALETAVSTVVAQSSALPLTASVWAASIRRGGTLPDRLCRGGVAIVAELAQLYHFVGWLPTVLGFAWHWRRLRRAPELWMVAIFAGLLFAVMLMLVVNVGYVSDRHLMTLVLLGCPAMAAGCLELPARLRDWWLQRSEAARLPTEQAASRWQPATWALALLGLFIALCLPRALLPLHGNRAGHLAAGRWLAQRAQSGDLIADDHCWSHYYAGKVFEEGTIPVVAAGYRPLSYVVFTRSRDPEIDRLRKLDEAKVAAADGRIVFHWPSHRPQEGARVVVYSLPLDKFRW